jgi:hypothetical protein
VTEAFPTGRGSVYLSLRDHRYQAHIKALSRLRTVLTRDLPSPSPVHSPLSTCWGVYTRQAPTGHKSESSLRARWQCRWQDVLRKDQSHRGTVSQHACLSRSHQPTWGWRALHGRAQDHVSPHMACSQMSAGLTRPITGTLAQKARQSCAVKLTKSGCRPLVPRELESRLKPNWQTGIALFDKSPAASYNVVVSLPEKELTAQR